MTNADIGSKQGIRGAASGFNIGGTTIFITANGTLDSTDPTPNRVGDILISYLIGKMWIAGGTSGTSDWKLVTSA